MASPRGIQTATLAEIYVRQGHLDRAIGIYEDLLRQRPDDRQLARRLAEIRSKQADAGAADVHRRRLERLRMLLTRVRERRREG